METVHALILAASVAALIVLAYLGRRAVKAREATMSESEKDDDWFDRQW